MYLDTLSLFFIQNKVITIICYRGLYYHAVNIGRNMLKKDNLLLTNDQRITNF